jgi:hypothetical protein
MNKDKSLQQVFQEAYDLINKEPKLLGFLYDLNLLPEQVEEGSSLWLKMMLLTHAFKLGMMRQQEIDTPSTPPADAPLNSTDGEKQ